jgi:hypothetical protein
LNVAERAFYPEYVVKRVSWMKRRSDVWGRRVAISLVLLAAGCSQNSAPVAAPSRPDAVSQNSPETYIAGTALPAGYNIDANRSLILGTGDSWTGRLSYTASGSADEVFDFLRREMPNFGWIEISAVRSDINLLTFDHDATGRIATVRIERGTVLGSTRVDMIVAPRNSPASQPAKSRPPAPIAKRPSPS